jgi:DNA-directed RNA polymerase alpha subunit
MAVTRIPIPAAWANVTKTDDRLALSLSEIDLSVRTVNVLEEDGIFTVGDLLDCPVDRILGIKNIGLTTLKTIYDALAKRGFHQVSTRSGEERAEGGFSLLRSEGD